MYDEKMVTVLQSAFQNAVSALRSEHNENFYYYAFIYDEGLRPYISALSYEAYEKLLIENNISHDEEGWKWCTFDFPYCDYGYDEFFKEIENMLLQREKTMSGDELYGVEWDTRIDSMEEALKRLDKAGFFGTGEIRKNIIINVEVAPPDCKERQRAIRLNPESSLLSEYLTFCEDEEE
ncbi:MAG: DUF4303 domain-containing protein [Ruminococcus sp.]|nr:DUF4303 domain-containing protein [Ruminococcus sp.]